MQKLHFDFSISIIDGMVDFAESWLLAKDFQKDRSKSSESRKRRLFVKTMSIMVCGMSKAKKLTVQAEYFLLADQASEELKEYEIFEIQLNLNFSSVWTKPVISHRFIDSHHVVRRKKCSSG